jgi:hypothetical protein
MNSQKVPKALFPSFRRKPESSFFDHLQNVWTPVFTGVTTFYEAIKDRRNRKISAKIVRNFLQCLMKNQPATCDRQRASSIGKE